MLAIKNWWSKQLLQTRITIILVAGLSVGLLFCSLIGYSIISNIISSNIQFQISNINPRILGFHGFESENLSPDMPFIAHISRELMTALVKYLFFTTIFIVVLGGVVAYFVSKKQLMEITKTNQAQENFVSDVSHELRTPLTVIRGQIDLYKTKRNRAEGLRAKGHTAKGNSKRMPTNSKEFSLIEADKHLENIEYSTIQMQNLLDELLALSRLDANKGLFDAKVNLIEAIHLAIRSIPYFTHPVKIIVNKQIIANKQNIAVENDRSANEFENLVFIKSDGGQIKRLFINLLTNIEKYAPGNTPVEIVIVKGTKTVTVKVVDHGKGVSPDELPKLYERFYTTEKSRNSELSGTGLGLAIVAEIVKKSGGVIKAENTSGSGLTHKIIFSSSVK